MTYVSTLFVEDLEGARLRLSLRPREYPLGGLLGDSGFLEYPVGSLYPCLGSQLAGSWIV